MSEIVSTQRMWTLVAPKSQADVLSAILEERRRQDAKWGDQSHRTDGTSKVFESARDRARRDCDNAEATASKASWTHILREETLEAFSEVDPVKLRTELVQCGAVIVAWIEAIDTREAK